MTKITVTNESNTENGEGKIINFITNENERSEQRAEPTSKVDIFDQHQQPSR